MINNEYVINLHLTEKCNYKCLYCFAKFGKGNEVTLQQTMKIVDNIATFFNKRNFSGRINLVGGEPLLVYYLDNLIDYILTKQIKVSIVTNASLLTKEMILAFKGRVETIGLSIDSLNKATNIKIGRAHNGKVLTEKDIVHLTSIIEECGIKLKINTVISKINLGENLSNLYSCITPERKKLFQVLIMEGVNKNANHLAITKEEFRTYCAGIDFANTIMEESQDIIDSYIIVNPFGQMVTNKNGCYEVVGDCITEDFETLLKKNDINNEKFNNRYMEVQHG